MIVLVIKISKKKFLKFKMLEIEIGRMLELLVLKLKLSIYVIDPLMKSPRNLFVSLRVQNSNKGSLFEMLFSVILQYVSAFTLHFEFVFLL